MYSLNAGKLFMPASNMKMVTAAAALAQLGADYSTDPIRGGRVHDGTHTRWCLIVTGRGDPTMSGRSGGDALAPFRDIADSLKSRA